MESRAASSRRDNPSIVVAQFSLLSDDQLGCASADCPAELAAPLWHVRESVQQYFEDLTKALQPGNESEVRRFIWSGDRYESTVREVTTFCEAARAKWNATEGARANAASRAKRRNKAEIETAQNNLNVAAFEYIASHKKSPIRAVAKALHCHTSEVAKTEAWRNYMKLRTKEKEGEQAARREAIARRSGTTNPLDEAIQKDLAGAHERQKH